MAILYATSLYQACSVNRTQPWLSFKLNDGSHHRVYKRWFTAPALADELGGGEIVHAGPWFVAVRA